MKKNPPDKSSGSPHAFSLLSEAPTLKRIGIFLWFAGGTDIVPPKNAPYWLPIECHRAGGDKTINPKLLTLEKKIDNGNVEHPDMAIL